MSVLEGIVGVLLNALSLAFGMTWEILWALILGFNYTTVPNAVFLILAAVLVWRFLRTGGPQMLKEM